jgi:putative Mg2+ transporter-C (MgtC) family protein
MADWLSEIGTTIGKEFSDVSSLAHGVQLVVRLSLAAALGGLLGYERERHGKAAGMRTHMLVSIGAAIFVLVPQFAGMSITDLSRVLQGIATGIGFLGAGTILKADDESHLHGLTTAAGIWMTAAIGVTVGLGHELTAIICTILALVILAFFPHVRPRYPGSNVQPVTPTSPAPARTG